MAASETLVAQQGYVLPILGALVRSADYQEARGIEAIEHERANASWRTAPTCRKCSNVDN